MTLISALISIKGTAVSTDSILTIRNKFKPDSFDQVEWNLPKLVRLEKFCGTISFWGDAVAEPKYPIPRDKKKTAFNWTLYDWLKQKCRNINEPFLEAFVSRLTEELKEEYAKRQWLKYGIGLHITGYELVDGIYIPELFLVSNYANTEYAELRELSFSRETFHTMSKTPSERFHGESEYRMAVYKYLLSGEIFIYNNGDPNLFNPVFNTIFDMYLNSKELKRVKQIESLDDLVSLISRPIEVVTKFQSDFFKEDKVLIGGKIHNLAVWRDKNYYSTSGD